MVGLFPLVVGMVLPVSSPGTHNISPGGKRGRLERLGNRGFYLYAGKINKSCTKMKAAIKSNLHEYSE